MVNSGEDQDKLQINLLLSHMINMYSNTCSLFNFCCLIRNYRYLNIIQVFLPFPKDFQSFKNMILRELVFSPV